MKFLQRETEKGRWKGSTGGGGRPETVMLWGGNVADDDATAAVVSGRVAGVASM